MIHLSDFPLHSDYEEYVVSGIDSPNVSLCESERHIHYNGKVKRLENQYFTVESLDGGTEVLLYSTNSGFSRTVSVSVNGGMTWHDIDSSVEGSLLGRLGVGKKLLIRGVNDCYCDSVDRCIIRSSGRIKVYGNIMSLLHGDGFSYDSDLVSGHTFNGLFSGCTGLVSSCDLVLPPDVLAGSCYRNMFRGCSSMVDAPELPATVFADNCYAFMFYGCSALVDAPSSIGVSSTVMCDSACTYMFRSCTSLVTAPELPSTTLADSCYSYMFYACTSLVNVPELPGEVLENACYASMFGNCTSLTSCADMLATDVAYDSYNNCAYMYANCTSLVNASMPRILNLRKRGIKPEDGKEYDYTGYCFYGMFQGCTGLVNAPVLYAETLGYGCYCVMFRYCSKLSNVPKGYLSAEAYDRCYDNMFVNCTSLVVPPDLPSTVVKFKSYYAMFQGCTNLESAPELPALVLADTCYNSMFRSCGKINRIKMMATDISANACLTNWVNGVASTGTFIKNAAAEWDVSGVNGVPNGWTVETATV